MRPAHGCCLRAPTLQIPSAALSPEKLAKYVPEGTEAPAYISEDVENIKEYYNIGACAELFYVATEGQWLAAQSRPVTSL